MSELQPHKQRVVQEKADLDEKISKLSDFIGSLTYRGLHSRDQDLLQIQRRAMREYSAALGARIQRFGGEA